MTATVTGRNTTELGTGERVGAAVIAVLATLLGVIGFVNSFERVEAAVAPSFGGLAWSVPLGIDIGIAVFTGLDLVMARLGMRLAWLRVVPWALVAVTIYLNVADEADPVAMVAHAALPGLWVIAVEVGAHMVRHWAGLNGTGRDRQRLDRVRLSRWVLAPVSTARLRRRMILQEIVSYREALAWDGQRRRSKSDLQDRYGRLAWRWQAPRRERLDYRLGDHGTHQPAALPAGPAPATPARRRAARPTSTSTDRKAAVTSDAELAAAGKRVAARIEHRGGRLTRRALVDGLRNDEGLAVGNDRATALLARLRDGAVSSTTTPTTPAPALADRRPTEEVPA